MAHPLLLGILNITADSFSDGGRFLDPEAALAHARKLIADNADALDVGGASSNPNSDHVPTYVIIGRLPTIFLAAKAEVWKLTIDIIATKTHIWSLSDG